LIFACLSEFNLKNSWSREADPINQRRYFRVMPPGQNQVEASEWLSSLSMDDLLVVEALVESEIQHRTGKQKFQFPPHVLQMPN
jgi:hypothetical protein